MFWTEKLALPPGAVADRDKGYSIVRRLSPATRITPNDRLWVRETWGPCDGGACYRADEPLGSGAKPDDGRWHAAIHMPRWVSRLTLIVTAMRVEPLRAINDADAIAEGIEPMVGRDGGRVWRNYGCPEIPDRSPRYSFITLWRALHGIDSWEANPDVVALTFTVHHRNIDA
jgi:hypothetical protein